MKKHTLDLGEYFSDIIINEFANGISFEVFDKMQMNEEYTGNINYSGCIHIYTDCLHLCEPEDLQQVQEQLTKLKEFWRTNCENAIL